MRVWLDKDSLSPFYWIVDGEKETLEYCRDAREIELSPEDFAEHERMMTQFLEWQEHLERLYNERL